MTVAEFKRWYQSFPEILVGDFPMLHNRGELMLYSPDKIDGHFISIERDGTLRLGEFQGNINNIGDAVFMPIFKKKFNSFNEAVTRVVEFTDLELMDSQKRVLQIVEGKVVPNTKPFENFPESNCYECRHPNGGPSHNGSSRCRSFSIASGGHRAHCSCDTCY